MQYSAVCQFDEVCIKGWTCASATGCKHIFNGANMGTMSRCMDARIWGRLCEAGDKQAKTLERVGQYNILNTAKHILNIHFSFVWRKDISVLMNCFSCQGCCCSTRWCVLLQVITQSYKLKRNYSHLGIDLYNMESICIRGNLEREIFFQKPLLTAHICNCVFECERETKYKTTSVEYFQTW